MTDVLTPINQLVIANIRSLCFKCGLGETTEGPIHL